MDDVMSSKLVEMAAGAGGDAAASRSCRQVDLLAQAQRLLPGGALSPSDHSVRTLNAAVLTQAAGPMLQDAAGRRYVDFAMGGSALILGHADPAVTAAVAAQVPLGTHYYQLLHEPAVRLAATMRRLVPCAERLFFTSTGSDAVSQAIRVARAATGRQKVLRFEGAYHGTSDVALVAMLPVVAGQGSGTASAAGVPQAHADLVLAAPFGDLAATAAVMAAHRGEIAALLVDPLQRWLAFDPDFLHGLRRLCDENDVPLIFDEVVTGFRMAPGGAQEVLGVTPDLAAYGKILGGGLPLGAVAGRAGLMEMADASRHAGAGLVVTTGTFNANVLSCVAGQATLVRLATPGFHHDLDRKAAAVRRELQAVLRRHGVPAVVGGASSFWTLHFAAEEPRSFAAFLATDRARARELDGELLRRGIWLVPGARRSISAAHDDASLAQLVETLDAVCRAGRC